MKRIDILGCDLRYPEYILGPFLAKRDFELQQTPVRGELDRLMAISHKSNYAIMEHLGLGPITDIGKHSHIGLDYCLEYYLSEWWKAPEIEKYEGKYMDKSRPDRQLRWWGPLSFAFLFAGLTGRWDDLKRISLWFDETVAQDSESYTDGEFQQFYLFMIWQYHPAPPMNLERMLSRAREAKCKTTKLFCAAWEAAHGTDQKAFDKAFTASVKRFLSHEFENSNNMSDWVALQQTIIWLLAERNGLKFPSLPEKLDAAVLRRETCGLA